MEYGWLLLRTLLVLAAVCALAYAILRWGLRRFVPSTTPRATDLEVIERLGVAPKQSLLLVRAGSRHLLIGSSEAGLQHLAELSADELTTKASRDGALASSDPAGVQ